MKAVGTLQYKKGLTPKGYKCGKCAAKGVKLWRIYQTFLNHQELFCAKCAVKNQKVKYKVGVDGKHEEFGQRIDQIGWLVPAVPTEDGATFWGYTSVPQDGCAWWYALPVK